MSQPISQSGVYDIEISAYHHDPNLCDGPSISASGLKELLPDSESCPAKFWAFCPQNPNRFTKETTKALDAGKAAHCLRLGEPEFAKYFFVSPYDRHNANPGKQWYDGWKAEVEAGRESRILLKPDEFEAVKVMAAVQRRSAQVMRAFEDGRPEMSLIWRDEETGIWLRARPDWLPNDPATRFLTEFKTAVSIEPAKMSADAFKYGYEIQAALQLDGVRAVLGVEPLGFAHVVQEKDEPYLTELRMFTEEQIADGRELYRLGLQTFAHCLKTGEWPQYTNEPTYYETPYRHTKMMENIRNDPRRFTDKAPDRSKNYSLADYLTNG